MLEINGKYTNVIIYANTIEDSCIEQVQRVIDAPIFKDAKIRIMPDCHTGKGSVIYIIALAQGPTILFI